MLYLLALLVPFLYVINLGAFQVWSPNEAFYADSARRMLQSGDYITPYYNGEIRLNKPPMTYWLVVVGYQLLGVNEWGLRLMHALLGLGTGIVTMLLARELTHSWKVALLSFLMLTLSLQFFANSQYASPEVPFTFFISLSLYLWLLYYRRGKSIFLLFAFLSSSLAVLVKGPAGFVLPASVVFVYLLLVDPKELLKWRYYLLSAVALALGLWWHVYQLITKGELFWEVFYRENIKRIYHGDEPFYFYFADLTVSFLPYSLLFFPALFWVVLKVRREFAFPLVWFSVIYGLFSLIAQKIPVYVLPAFPALSVITAGFLLSADWERLKKALSFFLSLLMGLAVFVGVFVFSLSPAWLFAPFVLLLFFFRNYRLAPAMSGISLLLFLKLALLPTLEEKREVRSLGQFIKELDPQAQRPTYQIGHFTHSLPFYAERRIIRQGSPQPGSVVVFKVGTFEGCQAIKSFRLYTGSESRLFRFLTDARRGKRFEEFGVCLY